jgi:hypothetical protein
MDTIVKKVAANMKFELRTVRSWALIILIRIQHAKNASGISPQPRAIASN